MKDDIYTARKVSQIYSSENNEINPQILDDFVNKNLIPNHCVFKSGAVGKKGWNKNDLHLIGEKLGFINPLRKSTVMAVFTTKGGVLKTTLSLNFARMAALHNIRTCVVGLDMQGDITYSLGYDHGLNETDNFHEAINKIDQVVGLYDLFNNTKNISSILLKTDLPKLSLIPETPELVSLSDALNNINRREYWLKDKVIKSLKNYFDLIILDCSPNWNRLTTNALVSCDFLVSPLECKINNYRNFKVFKHFLTQFKEDMGLDFKTFFVPTRFNNNRKLSKDIKSWYHNNVEDCLQFGLRDWLQGEEAMALNKSIIEHAPSKKSSDEMKLLLANIFEKINIIQNQDNLQKNSTQNFIFENMNNSDNYLTR